MTDSRELFRDYAENGSESAFRELVSRYTDLVYSTATRLVGGDSHLAQDVAQTVFIDFARMARTLSAQVMLGGWLHRHTCFVAQKTLRTERRRKSRERKAAEMNALNGPAEPRLGEAADVLDEAIDELKESDRAAIILRFFQQADFRAVGQALGTTDDTAQKRVSRALEKLQSALARRGVAFSVGALATALAAEAVTAAPAGAAANLAAAALAGGTAAGTMSLPFLKLAIMTKLKIGIMGAIVLGAIATPLLVQHQAQFKLREKDEQLRQANEQLAAAALENERLSNLVARSSADTAQGQLGELLRLRGEVGSLKRQLA